MLKESLILDIEGHSRICVKCIKSLSAITLYQKKIPWKDILTSKCVWGVVIAHLASNWGNYQLNSLLPTYLSTVLQ